MNHGPDGEQVLPMGARLQLTLTQAEIDARFSGAAWVIATALREYGMYLGDEGPDFTIYAQLESSFEGDWSSYGLGSRALATLTASDFHVLKLPPIGGDPP